MKNRIINLVISALAVPIIILIIFSCHSKPAADRSITQTPRSSQNSSLTFVAVGDNLFHDSLIRSALMADGTYDFIPIYTEVKSIVQGADLAFINQETIMGGTRFGYTGYPAFNTPQSLAPALADTGFEIINLANNHAMDKGRDALYATLDYLDTFEQFVVIGARKEGESARIVTRNNMTLGFLAYTFSLNGIPLPRENPNLVSMIDRNKMTQEMNALRPLCDFLIVSIHWGGEYLLEPDRDQVSLANFIAQHNVDLIVGHHPHVLQRVDTIARPDGKTTLCYYSLGNFASHQRQRERIIGGMMVVTFTKTRSGELAISDYGMIPVITHYDRSFRNTKVIPLYSYTEELLANHGLRTQDPGLNMNFFYGVLNRINAKVIMHNPFTR
ncbi:MAG: CapA family protein [Treponema sp.]|nr:CapA family protein [Treponema sp.]